MLFFVGLHQPSDARHFDRSFISINRLHPRAHFQVQDWIIDSGAFTELSLYGHYRHDPTTYAAQINRWTTTGHLLAAITQDYMCEPFILAKTGLSLAAHQRLTIERYDTLKPLCNTYLMPVLQGYDPQDYIDHIHAYAHRLPPHAWTGVGSICKRNRNPEQIALLLSAIKNERPDLRLHGFGLKTTALQSDYVQSLLHSADSMAWSYAARKQGRNANNWQEARDFITRLKLSRTR